MKIIAAYLHDYADFILNVLSPVLWCIFFIIIMDRNAFLETWFMPFLGLLAAFLANSVPIGGGIIYIPALTLLGAKITLGAAFTISVMPIGNGIFGLLRWMKKDPSVIIWESFYYTVFPSWIGSALAIYFLPKPDPQQIKFGFAWFCFLLGVLVLLALYRGGLRYVFFSHAAQQAQFESQNSQPRANLLSPNPTNPTSSPSFEDFYSEEAEEEEELEPPAYQKRVANNEVSHTQQEGSPLLSSQIQTQKEIPRVQPSLETWLAVAFLSVFAGALLVPNIGIGPALLTYLLLAGVGYRETEAMVTGIVTGGWVCLFPLAHYLYTDPSLVPWKLWIMVLPGVYYGAKYAPFIIDHIGPRNVMLSFALFLFASAFLYWFH